jgi:hypothetical protein
MMGHRITHVALDICGAMENPKAFKNAITVNGKTLNDVREIKDFFHGQLEMGRKVLPFGDCEGFDFIRGCPGHYVED